MRSGGARQTDSGSDPGFFVENAVWTISYGGRRVLLKDAKGLRYLAQLLYHPGRRWPVAELAEVDDPSINPERVRKAVTNRVRQAIASIAAIHPELGLHLTNAVHTGAHCTYTPDRPVRWSGRDGQ